MADFLQDVVTAFNYSRFKVADDFRFVKDDNMKAYTRWAQSWVNSVAQDYSADSWQTYGTAFVASLGETLLDFVGNVGEATFIDPLRVGEGYKKGGFGYVEDTLRIVGVFGGLLKVVKLFKAARVTGGIVSCTPLSVTKAVQRASLSFTTVEDVAAGTGGGVSPMSSAYGRAWIEEVLPNISKIVRVEKHAVNGFQDIEALAAQRKGPVVFSVEWVGGEGHSMMAYNAPNGAFLLADQFGNAHTWRTGVQGLEVIYGPGSTKVGTVMGRVARFYSQSDAGAAYIIRETVLMQTVANAPLAQRIGIPLLKPLDRQFNLKLGFAASMIPNAPLGLKNAGQVIQSDIYLKTGIENIYGWWWFNMDGGIWCYFFSRDKTVRWFDINNHKNGQGKWAERGDSVEVVWTTGTRERWPLEISPSDQKGTSTAGSGKISNFRAVRVWDAQIAKIVGRWKMNCDKWIWNINFTEDGGVLWSDYYNPSMNGRGNWHLTNDGVYLMWLSGSRDEWKFEDGGGKASGKTTVERKWYPFEAIKTN